jgi:hypothetical protein
MTEWREQQQQFWDWITRPQDLSDSSAAIDELFAPNTGLSKVEALAIYNNAFHQRLIQIASEMYPILYNTLGQDVFTKLWLGYLSTNLPRPGAMSNMTDKLLDYVTADEQFGALPALHDIVRVETLMIELFDRADEPIWTIAQLQALPADDWAAMVWQPRHDWALLSSHFNLQQYWQKMHTHIETGAEAGSASFGVAPAEPDNSNFKLHYLLRRHQHRMQFQSISEELAVFLQAIQENLCFADICVRLAEQFPTDDIPPLSLSLLLQTVELELLHAEPASLVAARR